VKAKPKVDPAIPYFHANLERSMRIDRRFELAMSVEVAEHLHPARARSFVEDLTLAANVVLFGAAMRDQGSTNYSTHARL
jgi:hypothetical protein